MHVCCSCHCKPPSESTCAHVSAPPVPPISILATYRSHECLNRPPPVWAGILPPPPHRPPTHPPRRLCVAALQPSNLLDTGWRPAGYEPDAAGGDTSAAVEPGGSPALPAARDTGPDPAGRRRGAGRQPRAFVNERKIWNVGADGSECFRRSVLLWGSCGGMSGWNGGVIWSGAPLLVNMFCCVWPRCLPSTDRERGGLGQRFQLGTQLHRKGTCVCARVCGPGAWKSLMRIVASHESSNCFVAATMNTGSAHQLMPAAVNCLRGNNNEYR